MSTKHFKHIYVQRRRRLEIWIEGCTIWGNNTARFFASRVITARAHSCTTYVYDGRYPSRHIRWNIYLKELLRLNHRYTIPNMRTVTNINILF